MTHAQGPIAELARGMNRGSESASHLRGAPPQALMPSTVSVSLDSRSEQPGCARECSPPTHDKLGSWERKKILNLWRPSTSTSGDMNIAGLRRHTRHQRGMNFGSGRPVGEDEESGSLVILRSCRNLMAAGDRGACQQLQAECQSPPRNVEIVHMPSPLSWNNTLQDLVDVDG